VVPWASQYRESRVALDVSKLDSHADIDNAVSRVVPTQGRCES
jgi:outer membrane usher protein